MNLFDTGGCSCPSIVEIGTAGLHGHTIPPRCKVHERAAMAAAERERQRDEAQRRLARERAVYDELRVPAVKPADSCSCNVRGLALAGLTGGTIEPCHVHRPYAEPTPANGVALNSDALTSALAASVGAQLDTPDLPPAA